VGKIKSQKKKIPISPVVKNNLFSRWLSDNKLLTGAVIGMVLIVVSGWMHLTTRNTFKDGQTGLIWQDDKDAKNKKMNWKKAKNYCQDLSLALKDDWRVPAVKELQTIVDLKKFNPAVKKGFKNVSSGKYWASEQIIEENIGYLVNFKHGDTGKYSTAAKLGVRCVRGDFSIQPVKRQQ